ncbi:MAG: hypothetical protein WBQ23_16420, partial [Bacteroidota bacterium]
MKRVVCVVLVVVGLIGYVPSIRCQSIERTYPAGSHSSLRDIIRWNGDTLIAAGLNSTVIISINGGDSWEDVPTGDLRFSTYQMTRTADEVYLLAIPGRLNSSGLDIPIGYSSALIRYSPSTASMRQIEFPLLAGIDTTVLPDEASMRIAATDDGLYLFYSTYSGRHLFVRSSDEGATWHNVALPDSVQTIVGGTLHSGGKGSLALFAYVTTALNRGKYLFISDSMGVNWRVASFGLNEVSGVDPPILWAADHMLLQTATNGIIASTDTGRTWSTPVIPPFGVVSGFAGTTATEIYAFTASGEAYVSSDGGNGWLLSQTWYTPPFKDCFHFSAVPSGPSGVVVVDNTGNIHSTRDGGISWDTPRYQPLIISVANSGRMLDPDYGFNAATDLESGDEHYYGTLDGFRGMDKLLRRVELGYAKPLPLARDYWYAIYNEVSGSDTLISTSTDQGRSWEALLMKSGCPGCQSVSTALECSSPAMLPYPTTEGLRLSTDGGQTWPLVYPAQWTQSHRPMKIRVDEAASEIWVLPDALNPWFIVRGRIESGVWDTVYTMPVSQRSDLQGISDISVSDNGELIAVAYPVSMDYLVLLRSSDHGENWVSGKTFFGSLGRFQFMQSITMLKNGTGLLQIDRDDAEGLRLSTWQMSTDGFETWQPLLDVHSENSFGALGSGIMTAGSNAAILLFKTEVYRTTNGGVNWTKETPVLPSSPRIVSTWPQPAASGSAMNTIIDLTQPGSARLELYDL